MKRVELLRLEDFEEVWKIMEESFPQEERRTEAKQRELWEEEQRYEVLGMREEGKLIGFLAVWRFEEFAFLEHFAVARESRNGGIGARMLEQLKERTEGRIVLEVELPQNPVARRRILFYERNGFFFHDYPYIQPAMNEETKPVPLRIMATGEKLSEQEFGRIRNRLYEVVYHVKSSHISK